jgi:hypothetical protein
MKTATQTQRRKARKKLADSPEIRIETQDGGNGPRWVKADLVDIIDRGCGLALMSPLRPGSIVLVRDRSGENRAGVRWCIGKIDGTFRAGLEFLDGRPGFAVDEQSAPLGDPHRLDLYEVMQLSPKADQGIISHVYRLLAMRYHPDNAETGDNEMFLRLSQAYQVLSHPERRANYDRHAHAGGQGSRKAADREGASIRRQDTAPSAGPLRGWNTALRHS